MSPLFLAAIPQALCKVTLDAAVREWTVKKSAQIILDRSLVIQPAFNAAHLRSGCFECA
ncbi:hypothetical protein [Streptomyces chartreusis]